MPTLATTEVELIDNSGQATPVTLTRHQWTATEAQGRAFAWAGGVFGLAILILPIPIVHFGAIPIVLFGVPIAYVVVFKLYHNGIDMHGLAACPACAEVINVRTSSDRWPVHGLCPLCRAPYMLREPGGT